MLLGHPRVGVAELRGDYAHRDALLRERRRIAMAQDVERRWRINLGADARFLKGPLLVRITPSSTIISDEHRLAG